MSLYYRIKVPLFELKQQQWVKKHFYHDAHFKALDLELLSGPNPYPLAKVFPYGETPLSVFDAMAQAAELKVTDTFVDLGCGRGRGVFFLSHFFGCRSVGIDLTTSFISKAKRLAHTYDRSDVQFLCQDFLTYDFKGATCVYLYGTTYSEASIALLESRFKQMEPGSRIITVSEPLKNYHVERQVEASFNWGKADLFIHVI